MINLSVFVKYHADRSPERVALIYDGQRITYPELYDRIESMARYLAHKGVGEGDIVSVFMKNSAAFFEIAFASSYLGAIFLPINFRLAADECAFIARHAGAKILLADADFPQISTVLADVVYLDEAAQRDSRALGGSAWPAVGVASRTPEDIFRLMYTSGTTDRPKGVVHTYSNFYWKTMDHVVSLGLTRDDRLLIVGPLYHVGGFDLPGIAIWWLGGTIVLSRAFDETAILGTIDAERITGAWMAPVMVGRVLLQDRQGYDLTSFKWCIAGGEKTPAGRIRDFAAFFPGARFIDGFGLTETCSGDTLMEPGMELTKIGSTGRPLAHVQIEIRNEDGEVLPARKEGEICIRGPKVTKGYWKDPQKTAASFFDDWFRSGDIGYLDEDNFLFITDRKKDMIISGGENIASSEIENVIYQLPEVADCAVLGVPDEKWGERPVAVIVTKKGTVLTAQAVELKCRQHLGRFKVPDQYIFRTELPRNPSGKILKRVLREELRNSSKPGG